MIFFNLKGDSEKKHFAIAFNSLISPFILLTIAIVNRMKTLEAKKEYKYKAMKINSDNFTESKREKSNCYLIIGIMNNWIAP